MVKRLRRPTSISYVQVAKFSQLAFLIYKVSNYLTGLISALNEIMHSVLGLTYSGTQ